MLVSLSENLGLRTRSVLDIAGRFESDGTGDSSRGRTESGRVGGSIQVGREACGRREREREESLMEGGDVLRRGVVIVQSQWRARGGREGGWKEGGKGLLCTDPRTRFCRLAHEDWTGPACADSSMNEESEEEQI